MGTRSADHVTPLYPQKLALTSPTGGGRSVGIVRSRTKATEFIQIPNVYRTHSLTHHKITKADFISTTPDTTIAKIGAYTYQMEVQRTSKFNVVHFPCNYT